MRSLVTLMVLVLPLSAAAGEVPEQIAASGETLVATAHAVGAQIYECRSDAAGTLAWQFREPVATLFIDGTTVGRHYAGPSWELTDGSVVKGKVVASAPAASTDDIPLLKLEAVSPRGEGRLGSISTIHRINTRGGKAGVSCAAPATFLSVPYSADYAFYRKAR